jgi:hypothetical protein
MTVRFVGEARCEFFDAMAFYDEARRGLGRQFRDEAARCIAWVAEHPDYLRERPGGYRRINLRVFPYYIPYITRGDVLWVLAIAHGNRKPGYWISRRENSP